MARQTDITRSLRIVSALNSMMATRLPHAGDTQRSAKRAELALALKLRGW
jgi:hypothetical protein